MLSRCGWDIVRRGLLAAVAIAAGVLGVPSAALADFTWSGAGASSNWSTGTNWVGGAAPSGSAGTLSFPALSPGACTTCYQSSNDVNGLSATAISIDDSVPYQLTGNALTLGSGGITAAPAATGFSANIALPLTLSAPQTWSITGGSGNQQLGVGTVTGSAEALTVNFTNSLGILSLNDAEVGTVTITGAGVANIFGSLNGTDGNPVGVTGSARLDAAVAGASSGPLSSTGGKIQIGLGHPLDGTLGVNGAITLDSTTGLAMFIDQPGTTASTDYSQLTASGTVNLGGAGLFLHGPATGCPALHVGDVDTLVSTTGSLTGTFNGLPDGSTLALNCSGGTGTAPTVRINYTANSVTATVLTTAAGGTTTALAASPSAAVTNQPVTLTATVGPNSSTPSGTVAFYDNANAISGCTSQSVTLTGGAYTATCQTSFAAASSPHLEAAIFTPSSGSGLQGSTSGVAQVTVSKDATATTLYISSTSPTVGAGVTYVASVAPADSGPAQPSGSVQFLDNGTPIPDCAGQGTVVSGLASCVLSYSATGSHTITAAYSGDGSFTGSTSSAQAVTVVLAPPAYAGKPPSISGTTTQGQTLAETHATWTNSPTSFTYQWQDCDNAGSCTSIPGATGATYTLTASDVGHRIRVQEAAANAGGMSDAVSSAVTGVVGPPSGPPTVPVSTTPPVVTGPATVGRTLSTTNGGWSGTPPSGYAYRWQRCSSSGCTNIANATASTYTLTSSDLGAKVRVVVVAVNSVGIGVGVSNKVGPVLGPAQIKALLAKQLTPKGSRAKIGAVLGAGGYELSFTAPESGVVLIRWYLVPGGAHLASAKPVLVASGRATFGSAGTKKLEIKLTAYGKGLLGHASRQRLTAQGTFTASGQAKIVARATFTLTR